MILSRHVILTICPSNINHLRKMGYDVPKLGRQAEGRKKMRISVAHLLPGSNVNVSCRCDECGIKFIARFCRHTDVCKLCFKRIQMRGNTLGSAHKGKELLCMRGSNHPRWNPNKPEFLEYSRKVRWLSEKTYETHKHLINPHNYPRTLCGVEGGYQLDHKVSIKEGFMRNLSVDVLADVSNLQLLSWKDNRSKGTK